MKWCTLLRPHRLPCLCPLPAVVEGEMFQTELDYGSVEGDAFSRDVYQR